MPSSTGQHNLQLQIKENYSNCSIKRRLFRAQIATGPLQYRPPFSYETCTAVGHYTEARENRGNEDDSAGKHSICSLTRDKLIVLTSHKTSALLAL